MKPKSDVVMASIIQQIRETFPFDIREEELCAETCSCGCPKKLLEYIQMEIDEWERRLENGDIPNFRDIQKLAKTGKNIYRVLEKNNLVKKNT
ncbi:hypothetical protein [Kaarinaea lacus]